VTESLPSERRTNVVPSRRAGRRSKNKSGAWRKAYRASGAHKVVSSRRAGRRSINLPGRGVNPIAYPPEKKIKIMLALISGV